jgi:hypothetical protein
LIAQYPRKEYHAALSTAKVAFDPRSCVGSVATAYTGDERGESLDTGQKLTNRDFYLCIPFVFSGLLCFALLLAYPWTHEIRPIVFSISLLICLVSFILVNNKKVMLQALIAFIAIRMLWSLLVMALHNR